MKKIIVSAVVILVFALYLWFQQGNPNQDFTVVNETPTATPLETAGGTSTTPRTGTSTNTGTGLKGGTYTSDVEDALYGPVQVQLTISGGKITDVSFLQYPDSPGHTTEVSNRALPILKQEAITAQSANVHIVSGATQTSEGFIRAMGSALVKARV